MFLWDQNLPVYRTSFSSSTLSGRPERFAHNYGNYAIFYHISLKTIKGGGGITLLEVLEYGIPPKKGVKLFSQIF